MDKKKLEKELDLIIIGGGPAGLTSAIFAGRAKLNTVLIENDIIGGQIRDAYSIENYPGFKTITGEALTNNMYEQAESAGVTIDEFDEIVSVKLTDYEKIIETKKYIYKPLAVIIASGSKHKRLPIPEEVKFYGKGIHYCELCDGLMYQGKDIIVVGGGNSAVGAAIYLSRYAKTITLINHGSKFKTEKSKEEELLSLPNVKLIWNSEIIKALGENNLTSVEIEDINTKYTTNLKVHGIFVYIGMIPQTALFKEYVNINKIGYIEAGETTETNVKGVFAAGDVRSKLFRQATTAVSDGSVAALMAEKYISERTINKE